MKTAGKKEGGLGSVITKYKDRIKIGVGSDLRTLCVPEDQSIVDDPENARVESDNVDLLLDYYRNLEGHEYKEVFKDALLRRMNKNSEYKAVAYFMVLVLIKIDRLSAALQVAKRDLLGDSEYGFNNILMLLDGMLKYNHNDFTNDQLDEIEIYIEDLEEHTFRISERLEVIRKLRR